MSHKPKRDTAGRTHLHRACQRGAVAEVENILSQGKEFLNEEDNAGYMPLHEACLHGHLDVVKVLINNGAWLDVPSRLELDTPLCDAVDNGHADVVKYLLELGADPRRRNKQGQTVLDANDANRETPELFREIEDLLKVALNNLRRKRSSDDESPRASPAGDSHSSRDPSVASPVHQSPPTSSVPTVHRHRGNPRMEQSRMDLPRQLKIARREEGRDRQEAQREMEAREYKFAKELLRKLTEVRMPNEKAAKRRRLEEEAPIARGEALPYALRDAEESPAVLEKSKFQPSHRATFNYAGPTSRSLHSPS